MQEYDVIIIGAGPAGLQCARELAEYGIKVLVVERQKEIGEPNYSTAGTAEETVKNFGLPKEVAAYECDKFYFKSPSVEHIFKLDKYKCYVLDFRKLRQWLAGEVSKNGGEISVCTTVEKLVIENGKVTGVEYRGLVSSGVIKAKVIVDATGIIGILSKDLNIFDHDKTIFTTATELEMTNATLPAKQALCFYIGDFFIPNGYAWVFPLSDSVAKVGLARVTDGKPFNIEAALKKFIEGLPGLANAQPLELHVASFAFNHTDNCVRDNYIVIGSAAGLLNPVAGEGIRHALYSGRFAAQAIKEALDKGDTSEKQLSKFNDLWSDFSKDGWHLCRNLARSLYENTNNKKTDHFLESLTKLSGDQLYEIFFNYNFKKNLKKLTSVFAIDRVRKIKDFFIRR